MHTTHINLMHNVSSGSNAVRIVSINASYGGRVSRRMSSCAESIALTARPASRWLMGTLLMMSYAHYWYFASRLRYGSKSMYSFWLQENIYAKHGDLGLCPDGRDSTGKHWIHCWSVSRPYSFQQLFYTDIAAEGASRFLPATRPESRHLRLVKDGTGDRSATSDGEREGQGAAIRSSCCP